MCGIAGIVSLDGSPIDEDLVSAMVERLTHRGPNGHGVSNEGAAVLGHTRLSIIDLSDAGSQPMRNETRSISLVYNGEVYNYRELREELSALGHRFASGTDTEVVVHAYEEWGTACLHRFNGMFAFALWDAERRRLFCARDRFGIKPFHYARDGRRLLFASEIKALLPALDRAPAPNEQAIADFVGLDEVDHERETFFQGIDRLPAGHSLIVEEGATRIERWWAIEQRGESIASTDDAVEEFRALFDDAVRLRLRSDVPVGSCLSGGLDSSAVVCTIDDFLGSEPDARAVGDRQKTFSAVFPGTRADESPFIDAVVERTRVDAHRTAVDGNGIVAQARHVLDAQDEPFGSSSIVAQWHVMQLARANDVTVLMDGQGGDELLGGYTSFIGYRIADLALAGRVGAGISSARRAQRALGLQQTLRIAAVPFVPHALRHRLRARDKAAASALDPRLRRLLAPQARHLNGFDRLSAERQRIYTRALPALLRYEDRNSMAFSLEARLPFLDYRLVELSFRLDPSLLIREGETKWLLRRALADRLPPAIRDRRDKQGFPTPQAAWLAGDAAAVDAQFARAGFGAGYVDRGAARELLRRQRTGAPGLDFAVWRLLCLDLWLERNAA